MLEGNPDIRQILTISNRPTLAEHAALLKRIFRRYDLAMALQTSDRAFWYTLLAASIRVNAVPPVQSKTVWKRYFAKAWVEFDDEYTHTVLQNLRLLASLNVPPCYELVPPRIHNDDFVQKNQQLLIGLDKYAVLHVHPQWTYKRWTDQGWLEIGYYLRQIGLKLVLTGSATVEELDYIAQIACQLPEDTVNLAGKLTLAELTAIIEQAMLYIGPDTGITHLAAATGIPVIALFGPTNPVKWAPWPKGYTQFENPFHKVGDQQVTNVFLVQGQGACVPCYLEGCDRHRQSRSQCLDHLTSQRVKDTINKALAMVKRPMGYGA